MTTIPTIDALTATADEIQRNLDALRAALARDAALSRASGHVCSALIEIWRVEDAGVRSDVRRHLDAALAAIGEVPL